jgi:hypothetical protein
MCSTHCQYRLRGVLFVITAIENCAVGSKKVCCFQGNTGRRTRWYMRPLDWNTQGGRRRFSCGYKDRYDFSHQEMNSVSSALPFGNAIDPIVTASLTLNGHLRWPQDMKSNYFRVMTPFTSWRTMPSTNIYSYSFALQAHDWQPTSHLNFSRLDHVSLGLTYAQGIKASELISMVEAYNLLINFRSETRGSGSVRILKNHEST